jgi:serine/threonine-protein kinase RsbW
MRDESAIKPGVNGTATQDIQVQELAFSLDKVIPSDMSLLEGAVAEITAAIDRAGCWEDPESIGLAAREALVNAIVHGNHCDPQKIVRIYVALYHNYDLLIVVKDSGSGFDPSRLANPTAGENLLADHGRGIFLMRELMDEVEFRFDHGTEVHMRRSRHWLE